MMSIYLIGGFFALQYSQGSILIKLVVQFHQLKRKEAQTRYESLSAQLSALEKQISQEKTLLEEEKKVTLIKLQEARSRYQEENITAEFAKEEARRLNKLYEQQSPARRDC